LRSGRRKPLDRPDMAAQLVCDCNARLAKPDGQLPQKAPGRLCVPLRLNRDAEHVSARIHRLPEPDVPVNLAMHLK